MRSPTRTVRRTWRVAVAEGSISRSPRTRSKKRHLALCNAVGGNLLRTERFSHPCFHPHAGRGRRRRIAGKARTRAGGASAGSITEEASGESFSLLSGAVFRRPVGG